MAFVNETQSFAPKPPPQLVGVEALRAALKTIPSQPGIYKMTDAAGKILYVGKAKNLANRVTSYTNISNMNNRLMRMVAQVARVETIVTQNEAEALLVEASTIKRFSPRYNILLKDDKSFPYIRLDTSHPFPRIEKFRGAQSKAGEYFGPFASVGALNETMGLLQKIFLLRPCADTVFKNRSRPCLQYQIKRCSAPCVGYVDGAHYAGQIANARDFLKGRHRDVQDLLSAEMNAASEAMDYEKAGQIRDRIRALTQVQQEQGLRTSGLADADAIALARRGGQSVVQVYFFRDGAHFGNQSFHPKHESEASDAEVMAGFLSQFYQSHTPPPEILVSLLPDDREEADDAPTVALFEEAFGLKAGHKVNIRLPQRGDKLTLITNAVANAQASLARSEMEQAAVTKNLLALQELFGLKKMPQRIEVYDNSHISGTNAVGAFIVATPEGFDKKSYRTFNIKNPETVAGDDYAMMREVFQRRFKTCKKDQEKSDERICPDLVLIDGGLGQLNAVEAALAEYDVSDTLFVGIAKGEDRNAGREWFHITGREPFQLPINDPVLHYLQRLRDEVHRFAIGKHRNKRSAGLTVSALDDIPGIGALRKKALLQHFGSRRGVEGATLSELEKVQGISRLTAKSIYDYFHG